MKLTTLRLSMLAGVLLLLAASTAGVLAQGVTTASINGTVKSTTGEALPGANVMVVHTSSGTTYGTTTREDGRYNIVGLRVGGPYTLTVTFVGFAKQERRDLFLQLAQDVRQDFALSEQAIQAGEVVVMAERSAVLSAARTGAATNVVREQMDRLPTISRSFQDYYKLSTELGATWQVEITDTTTFRLTVQTSTTCSVSVELERPVVKEALLR